MTKYNDTPKCEDFAGDFAELMHDQQIDGYREGVDGVLEYIESIHAYPKLTAELKWAIKEGVI